jgi:hypothetical protein
MEICGSSANLVELIGGVGFLTAIVALRQFTALQEVV